MGSTFDEWRRLLSNTDTHYGPGLVTRYAPLRRDMFGPTRLRRDMFELTRLRRDMLGLTRALQ